MLELLSGMSGSWELQLVKMELKRLRGEVDA